MKLHSLIIKRIVAKVLYLLASRLCTLAIKVQDRILDTINQEMKVSDDRGFEFDGYQLTSSEKEGGESYDS